MDTLSALAGTMMAPRLPVTPAVWWSLSGIAVPDKLQFKAKGVSGGGSTVTVRLTVPASSCTSDAVDSKHTDGGACAATATDPEQLSEMSRSFATASTRAP